MPWVIEIAVARTDRRRGSPVRDTFTMIIVTAEGANGSRNPHGRTNGNVTALVDRRTTTIMSRSADALT
jgi:hypothetical protein